MSFIEVILPLPLHGTFTYSVSDSTIAPKTGSRVIVQFGKRKIYTGIILQIHSEAPQNYQPKEVLEIIDEEPVITSIQLSFFQWLSTYYMSSLGEVLNAALPAGLKISSESYLSLNQEADVEDLELSEREQVILGHLAHGDLTINDIGKVLNLKSPHSYIKGLREKKALQVFELVKDKYTPKKTKRIRLSRLYAKEEALDQLAEQLSGSKVQLGVLLAYLRLVPLLEDTNSNARGIEKRELLQESISTSSLKTLLRKGIFEEWEEVVSRLSYTSTKHPVQVALSNAQERAKSEILDHFKNEKTVLLHGITGSGKTEIYISLIQDVLNQGGQVLYLLPEIALTTQIIKRLSAHFGESFGVYHSKYSDNERVEVWQKVRSGDYRFVVGVRSAIFLPFNDLSLIVIDEEHENSFKQFEPAPRYHARDSAIYLNSLFHGHTLLGTATPSLETYLNAQDGKFGLVKLEDRYGEVALPEIQFANMIEERKRKTIQGNFSRKLLTAIRETLERDKQVILFQNRRGYAPFVHCHDCGYIPKCPNCDVSLTYHSFQNLLICHYCGHRTDMLSSCKQCQSDQIHHVSFGTEKIEEELGELLPDARIRRMDLDSTRSKFSYQKIIEEFEDGSIDILVGTQMVSKGLDFKDVELVGIFDADRMIHFPDFRSHERAYQLMHQVSGRAGRRETRGQVIIQTNDPNQAILGFVHQHNYEAFYRSEITERQQFRYPPYFRLIKVIFRDPDKTNSANAAQFFSMEMKRHLGDRVIGPVEPIIGKIRNQYLFELTLRIEKQGINLRALKELLLNSRNMLNGQSSFKSVRVIFDVDPV